RKPSRQSPPVPKSLVTDLSVEKFALTHSQKDLEPNLKLPDQPNWLSESAPDFSHPSYKYTNRFVHPSQYIVIYSHLHQSTQWKCLYQGSEPEIRIWA